MLAYVFWHWKQPSITADEYESRQRNFHAALRAAPPVGYVKSFSVAISQAKWAANGADAYEDWYLVEDFGDLGRLNEAAISASRSAPHDAAAAYVAGGTAGVYKLQHGKVLERPQTAFWFSKPYEMSYRELDAQLAPLVEQHGAALWMRQMVLGPSPEFCVQADGDVAFPEGFSPQIIACRTIWPPN